MQAIANTIYVLKPKSNDDQFVDRLHYKYTPLVSLVMLTMTVAYQLIVGKMLQCWTGAEFSQKWNDIIEGDCLLTNPYFILRTDQWPKNLDKRIALSFSYYKLVNYALLFQMGLFFLPKVLVRYLFWKSSGISLPSLLKELQPDTPQSLKERKKTSICVADKIWRAFPCAPVMPFLYVGYKLCNIILVFGQILLMNAAVGNHIIHPQWGYEVVVALLKSGFNWEKTGLFPLHAMCDTVIRQAGNVPPLSISTNCFLPYNFIYGKFYVFIWLWLLVLLISGIVNIIGWVRFLCSWNQSMEFVRNKIGKWEETKDIEKFVMHVGRSGILILQLIAENSNKFEVEEILKKMSENFANDEPALFAPKTINGSPSSASDVHQFTGSSNGFNGSTPSSATTLSSGPAQCSESGTIGITGLGSCTLPNAYNGFVPSSSHVTIGLPTSEVSTASAASNKQAITSFMHNLGYNKGNKMGGTKLDG